MSKMFGCAVCLQIVIVNGQHYRQPVGGVLTQHMGTVVQALADKHQQGCDQRCALFSQGRPVAPGERHDYSNSKHASGCMDTNKRASASYLSKLLLDLDAQFANIRNPSSHGRCQSKALLERHLVILIAWIRG